jgi:hypothetical protein
VTSIATSIIIPICGAARPGITISSSNSFPLSDIAWRILPSYAGGYLTSASRQLMVAQSSMRPDVRDQLVPATGSLAGDDVLLNSLCQFDILYCLLVATERQTQVRSFYPSSAAFDEPRAYPALVKVAGDDAVRAALFPDSTDADVAAVIYRVVRLAMQEAFKFGGRWWGPPPSVQAFLTGNGQEA